MKLGQFLLLLVYVSRRAMTTWSTVFNLSLLMQVASCERLDFVLAQNPVSSFMYGNQRVQIWASARNGPDVKPSEWNFRYDPILMPVPNEDGTLIKTTQRGNKWFTQFTLALDDDIAHLQAFTRLQSVYSYASSLVLDNVFALPVKYIKLEMPDLFDELHNVKFELQQRCPEKSACFSFSRPAYQFVVTLGSQSEDTAEKVEELLKTVPVVYEMVLSASTRKGSGSRLERLLGIDCHPISETVEVSPISGHLKLFSFSNVSPSVSLTNNQTIEYFQNRSTVLTAVQLLTSKVEALKEEIKVLSRRFYHEGISIVATGTKTRKIVDFTSSFEVGENCYAILTKQSARKNGLYLVHPPSLLQGPWKVFCDMESEGGGWTVFQVRDDTEPKENFTRTWDEYKLGFGDFDREFWLGNLLLWAMTNENTGTKYELRIDLEDMDGVRVFARYGDFRVGSESEKFQLNVETYNGIAGDSFLSHNGMKFSTVDADNDVSPESSCAAAYKGGWWYAKCHVSNLNGRYLAGQHTSYADGINWHAWKGYHYSMKKTTMKFRPSKDGTVTRHDIPELLSGRNTLTKPT